MIKHAVKRHFEGVDDELVTNYFDKLIQVPIRVPPLGTQEVRAYMMMLFIENSSLDVEEKEMIRNIYNGDWPEGSKLTEELKRISNNNNMGEIIKVFMITASGSEGINLRNTRYVHIMEPYWNPARIAQRRLEY